MRIGIMQPYFFPYFGYFQLIDSVDLYVNLDHVSFMKRSYMTRNSLINNTPFNISVHSGSQNKKCSETKVHLDEYFIEKFRKKLYHLYSKSRNFELVNHKIVDTIFDEQNITISNFNLNIIKKICDYLDINTKIIDTSEGLTLQKKEFGLKEITKIKGGTTYINAIGGRKLYSKDDFKSSGIELCFLKMGNVKFDNPYISILDLLYNYEVEILKSELKNYELL